MKNLPESNYRSRGGDYPRREPFFAMRIIRLMTKSAAAMEIGGDGVALVAIVAAQEDSCRYTRPVNFWNTQLAPLIGVRGGDPDGLRRVRERCVKAGWLQYEPGNKRQPARYFATIPAAISILPDGSSDESPHEYAAHTAPIQTRSCQESAKNPPGIRQESAENPPSSSPSPIPTPSPEEAHHAGFALVISSLKASNAAYDSKALGEWITWLTDDVGAEFDGEGAEVIRWATHEAKERGVEVRYARHLAKPDWTKACATHLKDWRRLQKGAA